MTNVECACEMEGMNHAANTELQFLLPCDREFVFTVLTRAYDLLHRLAVQAIRKHLQCERLTSSR